MKVKEIVTEASWAQAFDNVVNAAMGTTSSGKFGNKPGNQKKLLGKAIPQLVNVFFQDWVNTVQKLQNSEQARTNKDVSKDDLKDALEKIIYNQLGVQAKTNSDLAMVITALVNSTHAQVLDTNSILKNDERVKNNVTMLIKTTIKMKKDSTSRTFPVVLIKINRRFFVRSRNINNASQLPNWLAVTDIIPDESNRIQTFSTGSEVNKNDSDAYTTLLKNQNDIDPGTHFYVNLYQVEKNDDGTYEVLQKLPGTAHPEFNL